MKAVIPAAGLGTRLLPATKSMPKEMLPVLDKPMIQYVVEEAVASGIDEILIVTGRGKRAIEDHFDASFELEHHLAAQGKDDRLERVRDISDMARIHYVRQREPLGLGHAVLCSRQFVGEDDFAVLLGDDIFYGGPPVTRQLLGVYEDVDAPVFGVMDVPREEISRYGSIDGEPAPGRDGVYRVRDIVEKPSPEAAPSTLASMGRYIFTPRIFDHIEETPEGHGGEIQLTDAMARMAKKEEMFASTFEGRRLDVGNRLGFLEANVALALEDEDLAPAFAEVLRAELDRYDADPDA